MSFSYSLIKNHCPIQTKNIKVSNSVFRAIFKEYVLFYISFFRSNTVENILLSSFLSGNKSWDNLIFLRLSSIEYFLVFLRGKVYNTHFYNRNFGVKFFRTAAQLLMRNQHGFRIKMGFP